MRQPATPAEPAMIVIEDRALVRAFIVSLLSREFQGWKFIEMNSVESLDRACGMDVRLVGFYLGEQNIVDPALRDNLTLVHDAFPLAEIVLLSNTDDPRVAMQALRTGVRGFFTTSLSLDVALAGVRLVLAGGAYCPHPIASLVEPSEREPTAKVQNGVHTENIALLEVSDFTHREQDVVAQLQLGHSNKIIAAKLEMSENTVKMHVQHIMRKLRVRNRTEVVIQLGKRATANGMNVV